MLPYAWHRLDKAQETYTNFLVPISSFPLADCFVLFLLFLQFFNVSFFHLLQDIYTRKLLNCFVITSFFLWNPSFLLLFLCLSPFRSVLVLTLGFDRRLLLFWENSKHSLYNLSAPSTESISASCLLYECRLAHSLSEDYMFFCLKISSRMCPEGKGGKVAIPGAQVRWEISNTLTSREIFVVMK